jgi:hypothetical protein
VNTWDHSWVRKACDTGIIKRVQESITPNYEQGDEIFGYVGVASGASGAFGELTLANAESIAIKPNVQVMSTILELEKKRR